MILPVCLSATFVRAPHTRMYLSDMVIPGVEGGEGSTPAILGAYAIEVAWQPYTHRSWIEVIKHAPPC